MIWLAIIGLTVFLLAAPEAFANTLVILFYAGAFLTCAGLLALLAFAVAA